MARSKSNTGRKGATPPPEMGGLKGRLQRALIRFNEKREAAGLPEITQKEIGARSGLSQSVISDLIGEKNKDKPLKANFTAITLARMCLALEVEPGFVLIGEGDVVPELARRSFASPSAPEPEMREEQAPVDPPPVQSQPPPPPPAATPSQKGKKHGGRSRPSP